MTIKEQATWGVIFGLVGISMALAAVAVAIGLRFLLEKPIIW